MIRRIAIAAGIFTALFLAVFVYNFVAGEEGLSTGAGGRTRLGAARADGQTTGQPGTGKFLLERRDRKGRLVGLYRAAESRKLSENSLALTVPVITLYRASGQRIYIRADSGMLYAAEVGANFEPRRGLLKGRVRVFVDRSDDPTRPAAQTPDKDLVKIYGQEVEFDSDDLTIRMRGDVSILSAEADVFGRDLTILWNEAPQTDLKLFKIAHGRSMVIYEAGNLLDPASPAPPATRPSAPPPTPTSARPAAYFPPALPGLGCLVRTTLGAPEPPAAPDPAAPKLPKPHNIYLATFRNNVNVYSGLRSMRYADMLALTFEWDRDVQGLPGQGPPATRPAARAAARPRQTMAVPPTLIAMTAHGANPVDPPAPATRPATRPTTGPATQPAGRTKDRDPTVILWSGPLVIEPVGRTEKPNAKRYYVEAKGERILWQTEDVAAVCQSFSMRQTLDGEKTDQTIHLGDGPDAPIRMVRSADAGGERIRCRKVTFLPDRGQAVLTGPGRIITPPHDQGVADPRLALDLDEQPDPPGSDRLTWSKDLVATLEEVRTTDAPGRRVKHHLITGAVLTGRVELAQADSSDFVRCDEKLRVWMTRSKKDPDRPRMVASRAKAVGNVQARQDGRDISADEMTVHFAERDEQAPADDKPPTAGSKAADLSLGRGMSVRPVRLEAAGNVRISDPRGEKPLVATGERLDSDLVGEKAVIEGTPAEIVQGDTVLHGPRIHLDQAGPSLVVVGAGRLKFTTDRDLDGKPVKQPRPMVATWNKQMTFTGKKDAASFVGGVTVAGGDDRLSAREMDVLFEETAAATKDKAPPAGRADKAPAKPTPAKLSDMGLDNRRLKTITCRDGVYMNRVTNDENKRLIQRMRLTSEQLTYDAGAAQDAKSAKMTVDGPGTMSMEDYKPPEPKDGKIPLAQPSQTLFVWKRGMAFSQKDGQVVLHGGVTMRHRGGDQIVLAERLNIAAMGRLAPGRNVKLSCEKMIASFDEAEPGQAVDAVTLGKLRRFRAIGNVEMVEGRRRMLGEVLDYDRVREIVVIEGTRDSPATLMYQPSPQAVLKTVRSTRIECFLKDNKIVRVRTDEITGG